MTVYFAFDNAELSDNAKETLDALDSNATYNVVGYASSEGTEEYNQALSERRAQVVAEYLKGRDIKVNTVEGVGVKYGDTTGRVVEVTLVK